MRDVEKTKEEREDREEARGSVDFFKLLCRDIGKYRLLSHEETMELIEQAQVIAARNNGIDEQIRALRAKNSRSKRIWQILELLKMQKRPNSAMQKIWAHNLRLVVSIARRFHKANRFLSMVDLVADGSEGLYEAVLQFDLTRGFKFSTYACWWVRHKIMRALEDYGYTIRMPVYIQDVRRRLGNFERRMWIQGIEVDKDLPAPPSVIPFKVMEEKGEKTAGGPGVAPRKTKLQTIRQLEEKTMLVGRHPLTIDAPYSLGADEGLALVDVLPDTKTPPPDARVELLGGLTSDFDDPQSAVERMVEIAGLNQNERDVIIKRFGIGMRDEMTLEQIGEQKCLSRERVRQIQVKAMGKLRHAARKYGLTCT